MRSSAREVQCKRLPSVAAIRIEGREARVGGRDIDLLGIEFG
jgi:hypothetical protein